MRGDAVGPIGSYYDDALSKNTLGNDGDRENGNVP